MDELMQSLAPVLIAGIAIQQILEALDPLVVKVAAEDEKKIVMGVIALLAGLALAFGVGLRVLQPMGILVPDALDAFVTALAIGAGTEAFNSIQKYLDYIKEEKKGDASALKAWVNGNTLARDALRNMDRGKR